MRQEKRNKVAHQFSTGTASNSAEKSACRKVLGAKPKQAGKKEGGWGEGIFARLLPFPFRLRKGKAEGGFGGNSAFPLRNQIEASPATCPNTWRAEHRRKILFSLKEEKIGRAQNEKSKEYFSVVWRARRAVAGLASLLGVLLKKSSNINQKTPPKLKFLRLVASAQSASALKFSSIFQAFLKSHASVWLAMRKLAPQKCICGIPLASSVPKNTAKTMWCSLGK